MKNFTNDITHVKSNITSLSSDTFIMKWIILLILFSNRVDYLESTPIGCLLSPNGPCQNTRTIKCNAMRLNDDEAHLSTIGEYLDDAVNNLGRLTNNYMSRDFVQQNSSTAGCSLGNTL